METITVQLTGGNIRNGHIYIRDLQRRGWINSDVVGASNQADGRGRLVRLDVQGIAEPVHSDVASEPDSPGKPRAVFRERSWVTRFIKLHSLRAGDMVAFDRVGPYHLRVRTVRAATIDE